MHNKIIIKWVWPCGYALYTLLLYYFFVDFLFSIESKKNKRASSLSFCLAWQEKRENSRPDDHVFLHLVSMFLFNWIEAINTTLPRMRGKTE